MAGRSSRPEEQPPRRQGGRLAWLVGSVPGLVALAFVVIVLVVVVAVIL
jgi:hypothetical protein